MKKKIKTKPKGWLWNLYLLVSGFVTSSKFKLKVLRNDLKKRDKSQGAIVIFNHNCNFDFWIAGQVFKTDRANFVVTRRLRYNKIINFGFKEVRAITRDQFLPDVNSILQMKRVIDNHGIVILAPTGTVTIHGGSLPIYEATMKLLKKFKVDVYAIRCFGTYLAQPKWATNKRKYPSTLECVKLFNKEELLNLSLEDGLKKVNDCLSITDHSLQVSNKQPIKGKNLTLGLEKILYICPKCLSKNQIIYHDNLLECKTCHNMVTYTNKGILAKVKDSDVIFNNEDEWYKFEIETIKKELLKDDYKLVSDVDLYTDLINPKELKLVGTGELVFNKNEFYYEGTNLTKEKEFIENYRKDFNLQVPSLPFVPMVRFNIPDAEGFFEFVPKNKEMIIEWVQVIEAFQSLKNEGALK